MDRINVPKQIICKNCNHPLPGGCDGLLRNESRCLLWHDSQIDADNKLLAQSFADNGIKSTHLRNKP